MKKVLFLIVLAIFSFTSCKKKNTTSTDQVVEEQVTKVEENLVLITFSKSACYGKCPTYTATITPDGKVNFNGIRFTPVTGQHEFKMDVVVLDEIMKRANEIKFFELNDKYDNPNVMDIPSTTLKLETSQRSKEIYARHEIPEDLIALNNYVHEEIMKLAEKKKTYLDTIKKQPNRNEKGVIISDKPAFKPKDY